jgi:hypothetical protein
MLEWRGVCSIETPSEVLGSMSPGADGRSRAEHLGCSPGPGFTSSNV